MDFGETLRQWENRRQSSEDRTDPQESREEPDVSPVELRRRLRSLSPDSSIDLHGLSGDEAIDRLTAFFTEAENRGYRKVLIIHGKGVHSSGGVGVLKTRVRDF